MSEFVSRRDFIVRASIGVGSVAAGAVMMGAMARTAGAASAAGLRAPMKDMETPGMMMQGSTATGAPQDSSGDAHAASDAGVMMMEGEYYKPVRLPAKPNAKALLTSKEIDEFERGIACPCPCTLDVFTCRTTMLSCENSTAIDLDVRRNVAGGHSADDIMQAMVGTYGNVILMAPPKKGANLIAWFAPFAALGVGALAVSAMLRGWRQNARAAAVTTAASSSMRMPDVGATDEEMARLRAVLRDDAK